MYGLHLSTNANGSSYHNFLAIAYVDELSECLDRIKLPRVVKQFVSRILGPWARNWHCILQGQLLPWSCRIQLLVFAEAVLYEDLRAPSIVCPPAQADIRLRVHLTSACEKAPWLCDVWRDTKKANSSPGAHTIITSKSSKKPQVGKDTQIQRKGQSLRWQCWTFNLGQLTQPLMPSLPRSGGFLEAIRQSSRELRISSQIYVKFLIDRLWFECADPGACRFRLKISRDCFFHLHSQRLLNVSQTKMAYHFPLTSHRISRS